jgi:hypothetical protein
LANGLRTHNPASGRLKNYFGEDDETMFQGFERPFELIFCIMGIEKATWTKLVK